VDLVARAKNILMSPKTEWPIIAVEPTDVASLYRGYIVPLAAIPSICGFIGYSIVGNRLFHMPIGAGLLLAILAYVLTLGGVFVVGVIISRLAPRFNGQEDLVQGLKVAAYTATASWIGGVFRLLPALGILGMLAGLYGLYLLYTGLPVLMKSSGSTALAYTVTIIIVAMLVSILISVVVGALASGAIIAL
jgi:hypothetical protein